MVHLLLLVNGVNLFLNGGNSMDHIIVFLGTGAADIPPELEGTLRDQFDKTLRRCSSALLDGHILIDCGPHALHALELLHISRTQITDLVLTHLHSDHFDPPSVRILVKENPKIRIWVRFDAELPELENAEIRRMPFFKPCAMGSTFVTGFPANHTAFPQHLSFSFRDGKKLFYGPDGAWFLNDTVYAMKGNLYDVMVLDCTVGDTVGDFRMGEHNSIPMLRLMIPSLKTFRVLSESSVICLSHIAHTLHESHEKLEQTAKAEGWIAAFDGMKLDF